jgi:hypothetical protein
MAATSSHAPPISVRPRTPMERNGRRIVERFETSKSAFPFSANPTCFHANCFLASTTACSRAEDGLAGFLAAVVQSQPMN